MKKDTAAEGMRKAIPAAADAGKAAAADAASRRSQDAMWERPAALITEVRTMTEPSLILLMTGENLWNLFAVQAR